MTLVIAVSTSFNRVVVRLPYLLYLLVLARQQLLLVASHVRDLAHLIRTQVLALPHLVTDRLVGQSELTLALLGLRTQHCLSQAACSNVLTNVHAVIPVLGHVSNCEGLRLIDLASLLLHQHRIQFGICGCQTF